MLKLNTLTLAAARQMIFAAETEAYRTGCPCTISVVDMQGQLIAQVRMDGAPAGRVEESKYKALNALSVGLCLMLHQQSGGAPLANAEALNGEVHSGQMPIRWEDHLIGTLKVEDGGIAIQSESGLLGAIGISSGSSDDDHAIALVALKAYASGQSHEQRAAAAVQPLSGSSFFEVR
jgi:glc operon protein GlcG